MYTGIVQACLPIGSIDQRPGQVHFDIVFPKDLLSGLELGASVAVDGVCLTVVSIEDRRVAFDVVGETLGRTTLRHISPGHEVNVERSARLGEEIGGHILSGHVYGMAKIVHVDNSENNHVITFECPAAWMKFIIHKGFVALDGISLTVCDTRSDGRFSVSLIPETLRRTTLGFKKEGDTVNLEIDPQTQLIVETVERVMLSRDLERNAAVSEEL